MSLVLNFSVIDYQIFVGNLDVTRAVAGFGVTHPQAEVGEPLIWSGTLNFSAKLLPPHNLPESLDNLVNPGRWAKGAHPVKLYLDGELFITLRILDYNYDEDEQSAEATLTDKLGLIKSSGGTKDKPLNGFAPEASVNLQGIPTITRQPWTAIAKAVATQGSTIRHQTLLEEGDVILPNSPGNATYSLPPLLRGDSVGQLANIVSSSANMWVWCDRDERIRFAKYPRNGSAPIYRLSRKQVEDFKRLPADLTDEVTTVEVEGQSAGIQEIEEKEIDPEDLAKPLNDKFQDDPNEEPTIEPLDSEFKVLITDVDYPIINESPKEGDMFKRQTIFQPLVGANTVVRREETLGRIDTVLPDSKNTNFITSEELNTQEYYSSVEGKLLSKRAIKVEPLGKIASDTFPGETARITSEDLTEDWEYNLDGTPIRRVVTIRRPACVVFKDKSGTGRIPAEKTIEEWIKLSGDVTGAKYQHQTLTYKTKGELYPDKYPKDATLTLAPDQPEPEVVDFVPQPIYKETRTPLTINSPVKEKEFDNAGDDSPGAETETTVTLTDVPDKDDALDEVAETAGNIRRQRIGARDISHPFRREDLLNFQPFQVVDVHNGRFVRDEFKIALGDDKELSCLYVGNLMGVIEPVPTPPTNILVTNGASTNIPVTVGSTITPIKLQSGQGVGPFTYSAEDLPDGLSLTGNEISGTPTATGTTAVTITVTDAASNTYTQVLNFNSAAVPVAIAHYRQVSRLNLQSQHQGIWQVINSPRKTQITPLSYTYQFEGDWQLIPSIFPIEVKALGSWTISSVSNVPINASYQGDWTVEPLYFRNLAEFQGDWETIQVAQFIYGLAITKWYLNPIYAPIRVIDDSDWTVIEVLPPSAAGHPYTASQSFVYNGDSQYEGTYTTLTDGILTTGAYTGASVAQLMADFGEAVVVASITVGAGTIGAISASSIASNLNSCVIQYSEDNFSWNTAVTITGVTVNNTKTFLVSNIIAQFWRIYPADEGVIVGTSEFSFT